MYMTLKENTAFRPFFKEKILDIKNKRAELKIQLKVKFLKQVLGSIG